MLAGLRTRRCRKYVMLRMSSLTGYLLTVSLRVLRKLSKHLLTEQMHGIVKLTQKIAHLCSKERTI